MSVTSYHFKGCTFPSDECICNSIQRDIDAGNRDPQPRDDIRVYQVYTTKLGPELTAGQKQPCTILDYVAPAPTAPKASMPTSMDSHKEACRDLLSRMFPGADLRHVGPLLGVNQEAPPQNRYTASFGFPFNRFEGRGPDEMDAYDALYTLLYNEWEKNHRDPQLTHLSFVQNYCQSVERDDPEALIPLADLDKAREEATVALADTGEVQNEHKTIDLKDEWAINPEAWPAPEVGPLIEVGSISYDDSEIERPRLPQGNPEFVRGYEFVTPHYSFVCSVDQPRNKIYPEAGEWHPLIRQAAYEKLQETVKRLTDSLLTEQQETAAAEEREAKAKAEIARLREAAPGSMTISYLVAEIEAKLAMRGDAVVRNDLLAKLVTQAEQRNYLASQSLVVRWHEGRPFVVRLSEAATVGTKEEHYVETAICGYDDGVPITFENVDVAIEQAMRILPQVREDS